MQAMLADEAKTVVLGELSARVKATGKIIDTSLALILTTAGGKSPASRG